VILLTGGAGQLGSAIRAAADRRGLDLIAPTRRELDILDPDLRMLRAAGPTVVIHCAALADTRACHDDPARAFAVNAAGALHVARACADIDALMVLVSTDAVFDGRMRAKPYTEDDIPHSPVGVYGTTKLAAEHLIARTCRTLIARTGWLFCDDPLRDRKLLGVLVRRVEAGQRVEVVTDKWGSPAFAPHVASKIVDYAAAGVEGVRHVVNRGVVTRYEFARYVFSGLGYPEVEPATFGAFPDRMARPDYSALASVHHDAALPHWRSAVDELVRGVRERAPHPPPAMQTQPPARR
jgi:dTDP-4-dehydrorhamnose reductase